MADAYGSPITSKVCFGRIFGTDVQSDRSMYRADRNILAVLTTIQEMLDSNLGRGIGYHN
jgi:hypothetical protein